MQFNAMLQTAAGSGNLLITVLPFVLIFVIFYFFIIRPQNKKQKETERMISALKKGDKIVTIGGIHGTVTATKEQTVIVKVDDNSKIEFSRSAIANVVTDKPVSKDDAKAEKKADKKVEKKEAALADEKIEENLAEVDTTDAEK